MLGYNVHVNNCTHLVFVVITSAYYMYIQGQLVGVVGKVGSGKSSLLAAITAEMRRKGGQVSHIHVYMY